MDRPFACGEISDCDRRANRQNDDSALHVRLLQIRSGEKPAKSAGFLLLDVCHGDMTDF
jgi:hypothetical protein